jgi:hypothetical protein
MGRSFHLAWRISKQSSAAQDLNIQIYQSHLRSQPLRAADRPNSDSVRCTERASTRTHTRAVARARKHAVSSIRLLVHADIVRQSSQQVQLAFHPSQDLLVRREELDVTQSPQISHQRAAEVAQEARVGDEEVDDEDDEERCCPCRDRVVADLECRVLAVGLDRFDAEEQEDPDARANDRGVAAQDEALDQGVDASREQAEGPGEQEKRDNGAVLHLEALEEWCHGDHVEDEVEDILMQERVCIEAVDCTIS